MRLQLNARSWGPAQVTSTGRLQAAPLQFALGSQLLLDETVLTDGQLAATGIHNLQVMPCAIRSPTHKIARADLICSTFLHHT